MKCDVALGHCPRELVICTFLKENAALACQTYLACLVEVFSLWPQPKQLMCGVWKSNIPTWALFCYISPLGDALWGESHQRRCPLTGLWWQSPVTITFLFRPLYAVWRSSLISPLQVNGRWSQNLKEKRRWKSLMESWFAPAITPMRTFPWRASLVSSLPGKKTLLRVCDLTPEEWEDCVGMIPALEWNKAYPNSVCSSERFGITCITANWEVERMVILETREK